MSRVYASFYIVQARPRPTAHVPHPRSPQQDRTSYIQDQILALIRLFGSNSRPYTQTASTMDIAPRAISLLVVGPIILLSWCANLVLPAKTRTESHSRDISNKSIAIIFFVSAVVALSVLALIKILEACGLRTIS